MEWNDEAIRQLRAYWDEGHSTAEIGRRMGVSKNAVVGKAHRLNLPARPSPIRRDGVAGAMRPAVARRVIGPTLPSLAAPLQLEAKPAAMARPAAVARPAAPVRAPMEAPRVQAARVQAARVAPVLRPVASRAGRQSTCCWPIGEPGTRSFCFCDADAAAGKPYCAQHAQLAYVKIRDRREEAA